MKYRKLLATLVVIAMVASTLVVMNTIIFPNKMVAGAVTPGVNNWGNGTVNYVYAPTTRVEVIVNTTGLEASTAYYLYKPFYNVSNSGTIDASSKLEWSNNRAYTINPDGTTGPQATFTTSLTPLNEEKSFGNVYLDRAGMWLVDKDDTHDGNATSSYGAFIWVNTSTAYTITGPDDFKFGVNTTKTYSVQKDGTNTYAYVDLIGPDGATIRHDWITGSTSWGTYGNITKAGNYTLRAYKDLHAWSFMYAYQDERTGGASGPYTGYGSDSFTGFYGANFSASTNTTLLANGDKYNYTLCGPFDPPDENATLAYFEVSPGTPSLSIPEGNQTMYWNFSGEVNISVKDSSGDKMPLGNYNVEVYNRAGELVASSTTNSFANLTITKSDGYVHITNSTYSAGSGWGWNSTTGGAYGTNGSWTVYIWSDLNGDRTESTKQWTEEWNGSIDFTVTKAPGVQFKWIDDDGTLSTNDNDREIPSIPVKTSAPITMQFQIIGDDHTFFGGGSGVASNARAMENITISGNSLFTGTLDKMPSVAYSAGTWSVPIIPTMIVGGGTITITAVWKDQGSITEIVSVGGTVPITNGTIVTVNTPEFEIGTDQNFEVTVTDAEGAPIRNAYVYLYFIGDGDGVTTDGTPVFATEVNRRDGGGTTDGKYYISFNTSQQRDNQTAIFGSIEAPRNLTLYVTASYFGYGYARIQMKPKSSLYVGMSPLTYLAGYSYDHVYINITLVNDTGGPSTEKPAASDVNDMFIKIYDADGNDVTDSLGTRWDPNFGAQIDDSYTVSLTDLYFTQPGVLYTVYAYNCTDDSEGHNATFEVKQAAVACDKEFFVWNNDDNISATFTISGTDIVTGEPLSGELLIDNMTWTDAAYNKTYANTSFDGTADQGGNSSINLGESEGLTVSGGYTIVTLNDITASFLPGDTAEMNITFWFKPANSNGNLGAWARASGRVAIKVPTIEASITHVPLGETSTVVLTTRGRDDDVDGIGDPISGVYVGLNGHGVSIVDTNGTTDTDGTIEFSILPTSTGDIAIHVGEEGRIVTTAITVTSWILDVSTDVTQVAEGDPFTVTVVKAGTTTPVEDATVAILGIGTAKTNSLGTAPFTAPEVTSDSTYTITVTSEGYRKDPDAVTIKVINVPKLTVSLKPATANRGVDVTVTVSKDDANPAVNAKVTIQGDTTEYYTDGNGQVTITAPKSDGTYIITATFGTFKEGTKTLTVSGEKPSQPGFELLTLIIAIGVAFILLRRRRK